MTIPAAPASPLTRAAAHLDAAIYLAQARARDDGDGDGDGGEMLSPWTNTADTITLAEMGLAPHLTGPVESVEHLDCRSALLAAAGELAQVRPGVDAPQADLLFVYEFLLPALQHAQDDAVAAGLALRVEPGKARPS